MSKHYTEQEVLDLTARAAQDSIETGRKLREYVDPPEVEDYGYPEPMTRDQWRDAFERGEVVNASTGRVVQPKNGMILRSDQPFARPDRPGTKPLSFGAMVRGVVTGDWRGFEDEQRGMSTTGASAIVPTAQASWFIDRARNAARVLQAGARVVRMDAHDVKVPRLTGSTAPAWRNEAGSVAVGDLTLDYVSLSAKSLAFAVTVSRELIQDSSPAAMDLIAGDLAAQVALEWDRVALLGSGSAPEPRGLFNASGVQVVTAASGNGGTIANLKYDFLLSDQALVRGANFEPNSVIYAPRTDASLSALKETGGQYIVPPRALDSLRFFPTNQVPINQVQGSSSDCSAVFMGEFGQLLLGN